MIDDLYEYFDNSNKPIESKYKEVSPYLIDSSKLKNPKLVVKEVSKPINKLPKLSSGSQPIDNGNYIFKSEEKLKFTLPLIIDPTGIHFRSDGHQFLCGFAPEIDEPVEYDDFKVDYKLWEEKIWSTLANRIPVFERIKLVNAWAGHYAFNTFDQNGIIGPHPEFSNFYFANGFSGHGLQQSPAVGRALSEQIIYNKYKSLDLSQLSPKRLVEKKPFLEKAII